MPLNTFRVIRTTKNFNEIIHIYHIEYFTHIFTHCYTVLTQVWFLSDSLLLIETSWYEGLVNCKKTFNFPFIMEKKRRFWLIALQTLRSMQEFKYPCTMICKYANTSTKCVIILYVLELCQNTRVQINRKSSDMMPSCRVVWLIKRNGVSIISGWAP